MSKHIKNVPAVTEAAERAGKVSLPGLGRAVMALQEHGAKIAASLDNGHTRSVQIVSTDEAFSAVIKHGNKVFQFEGDSFAVTTHD